MSKDSSKSKVPVNSAYKPALSKIPLVPWKPWVGIVAVLVIYYGSQFASAIVLGLWVAIANWGESSLAPVGENPSVFEQFLFIGLAEALVILALYLFLKHYRTSFKIIGLLKPRLSDVGYGLIATPIYFVLYLLTIAVVGQIFPGLDVNQEQQIGFDDATGVIKLALTFIALVIIPPITEEIMVRGFLYSTLKKAVPTLWAVLATSLIFAVAHLPEGGPSGPLYIAAIDTFILSLVLIYLREKTGSLWASITLHSIKNGVAFLALFVLHIG